MCWPPWNDGSRILKTRREQLLEERESFTASLALPPYSPIMIDGEHKKLEHVINQTKERMRHGDSENT